MEIEFPCSLSLHWNASSVHVQVHIVRTALDQFLRFSKTDKNYLVCPRGGISIHRFHQLYIRQLQLCEGPDISREKKLQT